MKEKEEGKADGEAEEADQPAPAPTPPVEGQKGKAPDDFDAILTSLGTGKFNIICYIAIAYCTYTAAHSPLLLTAVEAGRARKGSKRGEHYTKNNNRNELIASQLL